MLITQTTQKAYNILSENELKVQKLQDAFEKECDSIQKKTEHFLKIVPKYDTERRGKILDLHYKKLDRALIILQNNLTALSNNTDLELAELEVPDDEELAKLEKELIKQSKK